MIVTISRAVAALSLLALAGCGDDAAGRCGPGSADVANEGWMHVPEGTATTYRHNPPASGSHYPRWARYRAYDQPLARGYWLHNIEHGAVVLLYRPGASPDAIAAIKQAYADLPNDPQCGHKRAILTPDPLLDGAVAAVAADAVLEGDRLTSAEVSAFAARCRATAPEDVCADGDYP